MGSQLPGPPARLSFRLSLFSPLCRSSSLCPEGGACPLPGVPWQLLPTLQGTTKYLDKLFPVSSFPCRCTAQRPP